MQSAREKTEIQLLREFKDRMEFWLAKLEEGHKIKIQKEILCCVYKLWGWEMRCIKCLHNF